MNKLETQHLKAIDSRGLIDFDREAFQSMNGEEIESAAKSCTAITIEFAINYNKWYNSLSPTQKCTVHAPAGSGCGTGLYQLGDEELVEKFIKTL